MSRTLSRRLDQQEDCFRPAAEPMTIRVVFVGPNREVTGGFEFQVGAETQSSLRLGAKLADQGR